MAGQFSDFTAIKYLEVHILLFLAHCGTSLSYTTFFPHHSVNYLSSSCTHIPLASTISTLLAIPIVFIERTLEKERSRPFSSFVQTIIPLSDTPLLETPSFHSSFATLLHSSLYINCMYNFFSTWQRVTAYGTPCKRHLQVGYTTLKNQVSRLVTPMI